LIKKLFVGIIFVVLAVSNSFSVSPGEVVINELMWSGSFVSGQDEWLELRNMTNREIDLSNYQLTGITGEEEKAMITISEEYAIPANGYFLVSNYTEDSSALAFAPNMVSSSLSLSNSALQIKLYDQAGLLIDTAGDGEKPLAGDNTNKCSMERNPVPGDGTSGENWHTARESKGFDPDSKEKGTPGLANSLPETGLPEETVILINEVSFKEENGRDWIELYCLNDGQNGEGIEIGGCFLEDNSKTLKTIAKGTIIKSGEYLLLYPGDFEDELLSGPDGVVNLFAADLALVGTDNQLVFYDRIGQIEDALCWAKIDSTWSEESHKRLTGLVEAGEWKVAGVGDTVEQESCINSEEVGSGVSVIRTSTLDTNSKEDWSQDATPTPGRANETSQSNIYIHNFKASPNPFLTDGSDPDRSQTSISFELSLEAEVTLKIYDANGRSVKTLVDRERLASGQYSFIWTGKDEKEKTVPIGIYICYLEAFNGISKTKDTARITVVAAKRLSK